MTDVEFKNLNLEKYREMQAWCKENFGQVAWWKTQLENPNSPIKWYCKGMSSRDEWEAGESNCYALFSFKDEKDATMFGLKWSS